MRDIRMIIVLAITFFSVLIFMKIVSILSLTHRKYMNEAISGVFQRFLFNGYIGGLMVGYVKLNIAVKVQLEIFISGSNYLDGQSQFGAMFIVLKLFGTFLLVSIFIYVTQGDLSHEKFKRVRKITAGLNLKKNMLIKYYFPIFMFRRTIYVMIPVIFKGY